VDIFSLTRRITCDSDCKRQMKFDVFRSDAVQYGVPAVELLDAITAVEENVTDALHYDNTLPLNVCRITPGGEEYRGNLSRVPWKDQPPHVSYSDCIGWNEAARELQAAGLHQLAGRILAAGFADSHRSCRQPPGLPLTAFHNNAT
uniref:Peptidase_M16_M domain-containing protein n=1 Tax=Macrostomum lignano TaxID=282301 RepID=A0A1I8HBW8_9PLAT